MVNFFILVLAIKYGEMHTIAMCLNMLLGEFLEGCCESEQETARLRFNFVFSSMLSDEQRQAVIDACPFESVANDIAEKRNLQKPYELVSISEYGVRTWKRVRKDPTDLGAFKDIPDLIYGLWKKTRDNNE